MCNLYSQTTAVEAMRRLFEVNAIESRAGNLQPQRDKAPKVVNNTRDDKARASRFWESSFEERRCLIPASSFAEYHPKHRDENGHKAVVWFAMKGDEPRPPFAFAGIWRTWKGNYKGELREMNVYSMMTTTPNEVVKPIHPSRMPVILDAGDYDTWLAGSPDEATGLLKPFASERITLPWKAARRMT